MEGGRNRNISATTERNLWGIAAGRCEFEGCNKFLGNHQITKSEGNFGEKAHIEAVSKGGARYKALMSGAELNSADNLMLLCPECHKLIDENAELYPVSILQKMKRKHEQRIYKLTEGDDIQKTLMLGYFANIKDKTPVYDDALFCRAVVKAGKIPLEKYVTMIEGGNMPLNDGTKEYYLVEQAALKQAREKIIKPCIKNGESISIFALAPMPLLIQLGTLISDISNVMVFQCHREGERWSWKEESNCITYLVEAPVEKKKKVVALNISLSANIVQERVDKVQDGIATYKITIAEPNRYFVSSEKVADAFVCCFRNSIERIKKENPDIEKIMVFPAMPNSLAVRMGMDYMPKTDPILEIYDQIDSKRGFIQTIKIGGNI